MNGSMMGGQNGNMNGPMMGGSNGMMGANMGGQMGGPGMQGGMMGGPNNGQMMGPGDNSADMDKQQAEMQKQQDEMQKQQDERMKQQQAQALKQMQSGMKQMLIPITTLEKQFAALEKKGIVVPEKLKTDCLAPKDAIQKVLAATTMDEAQDSMSTLADNFGPGAGGDPIQQCFQKLQFLQQVPQVLKQITNEIARVNRDAKSLMSQAKRNKIDLSGPVADLQAALPSLDKARDDVKASLDSGDIEDPHQAMQPFFDARDEVQQKLDALRAVVNITDHLRSVDQTIRNSETTIRTLKRKKLDTSALESIVAEMKAKRDEIKGLAQQKPVDLDALTQSAESGGELQGQFQDAMAQLTGQGQEQTYFNLGPTNVPKYQQYNFSGFSGAGAGGVAPTPTATSGGF